MKDYFIRPLMFKEAEKSSKGHHWLIEILIFILVFLIINIIISIIAGIGFILYLVISPEFLVFIKSGMTNMYQFSQTINNLINTDWFMIVSLIFELLMIGGTFIYCRFIEKRKLSTLGFRKNKLLSEYLKGLLLGLGIFCIAVLICLLTGSLKITGISPKFSYILIIAYFIGFMIQGMAEEVLCRGYFMVSISRRYSIPAAVLISSILFAALHLFNQGITFLAMINLVLFGIYAALLVIKRGNIWYIAGIHSMWNFAQGNLFGIQVSGNKMLNSVLTSFLIKNKTLINGGSFGLEGGLAVTIVLLTSIGVIIYKERMKSTEPISR